MCYCSLEIESDLFVKTYFESEICIIYNSHSSVNEVICHGIPDKRPLENGDICNGNIIILCYILVMLSRDFWLVIHWHFFLLLMSPCKIVTMETWNLISFFHLIRYFVFLTCSGCHCLSWWSPWRLKWDNFRWHSERIT